MELGARMEDLRERQQRLLEDYREIIQEYRENDVLEANTCLKTELAECQNRLRSLEQQYRQVTQENLRLRTSLQEQIYDEKLNILKVSREKLATYFKAATGEYDNRLSSLEAKAQQDISRLRNTALQSFGAERGIILKELEEQAQRIREKLYRRRQEFYAARDAVAGRLEREMDGLAAGGITEEVIQKRVRQNEIEIKIGLNWINKIGIILILFGVGAAVRYSYSVWFNEYLKGTFVFLLGGLLMAGGEWFYRRAKDVFATGLLGGGIAILYCGVFYSYFLLHIIPLEAGLALSLLITLLAVVLSLRYRSRTICSIGLIGGYLPFLSYIQAFGLYGGSYYAAMAYLFLLNMGILLVSLRQRWNIISYISFILHVPSLIYLVSGAASAFAGIAYATAAFSTYLGMTLVYPLRYRVGLIRADIILLGFNTLISCLVLYGLLAKAGLSDYRGVLALSFCVLYGGLARAVEQRMPAEKHSYLLLYATAMTFAILMIPFQLGVQWLSLGWLVEGVILIACGYRKRINSLEKSGWLVFGLCLAAFYLVDWLGLMAFTRKTAFVDARYTAVVAGMTMVSWLYLRDLYKNGVGRYGACWQAVGYFKYFTLVNVWIYLLYISGRSLDQWLPYGYYSGFWQLLAIAVISLIFGYTIARIRMLRDNAVVNFSLGLYALSALICSYVNLNIPVLRDYPYSTAAAYSALTVLAAFNLLSLFVVNELLRAVIRREYLTLELLPLGVALYYLANITLLLTVQFRLDSAHFLLSLVYMLSAILFILYGFYRRFIQVRRLGLGLALFATAKLFIYDLSFLDLLHKIFAYFCFGIVLLMISYFYQRLRSSLEGRDHDKNINCP